MKKMKVFVSMGLVGCRQEVEFDIDDDLRAEEIEDVAREAMFEMIEWSYTVDGVSP